MAATASKLKQYVRLLTKFLPRGRLWQPEAQPTFKKFLQSSAQEPCRIDDRIKQLLLEVDPRTTDEALDQWETHVGLPDECTPSVQSPNERRTQVVQKFTNLGGLSKTFYEFIAAQLGFPTTIVTNHLPFLAGSKAGDPLTNFFNRHFVAGSTAGTLLSEVGWRYYFNVEMPVAAADHFVAGSVAGTPLVTFSNDLIECTMQKLKPAHSGVTFTFK